MWPRKSVHRLFILLRDTYRCSVGTVAPGGTDRPAATLLRRIDIGILAGNVANRMAARSRHGVQAALVGVAVLAGVLIAGSLALSAPWALPVAAGPHLAASQIVFQQGVSPSPAYTGARDTFISRLGDESANYGSNATLALRSADTRSALLRFQLDGLAPGDTVEQAILSLYVAQHALGAGSLPVSVYAVLRPWQDGEATWYNATSAELWTLAGCNGPSSDRAGSPSASAVITGAGVWVDLNVTGLVQGWVANPAANNGLILRAGNSIPPGPPQEGDEFRIEAADGSADPLLRPRLSVTFTPAGAGSPTATPTTVYGSPTAVAFQQLVSPPQYTGTTDTFISDYGDPDGNYGGDGAMRLRSNDHRASLIRFDVSSIPSPAYVYSATLRLYSQSRTNVNPLPVSAHRLLRPWVDMEATWYRAGAAQRWAFPGANGLTTDRSAEAFATMMITATGVWTEWPLTSLVQDWVAHPESNEGIVLKAGSGTQVEYSLVAAQYLANPGLRPRLEVVYALPEGPTPAATATRTPTATPSATATPPATPTVLVFQHERSPDSGYAGVIDTYISREGDLNANYGHDATLTIASNDTRAALLRFDVSSVPAWATVHSAWLSIYSDGGSNGYPVNIGAYRLLRPWNGQEATWINATGDTQWSAPGANGIDSDRGAALYAMHTVSTVGDWYDFDITRLVAAWIASPEDNLGMILKGMDGPQTSYDFIASQFAVAQGAVYRPRLIVAYSLPPGPTPTPTATRTATATPPRVFVHLPVIMAGFDPTPAPVPTDTATPPAAATATVTATPTTAATPTATVPATATGTATVTPTATATATAAPQTLVFRQGVSPDQGYAGAGDTYLSDYAPGDATAVFGDSSSLLVRAGGRRVALLRFDISAIPPAATVLAASLSINVGRQTEGSLMLPVAAYAMVRPWSAGDATWLQAASGVPWGSGGASAATDRSQQAGAMMTLHQAGEWYDLDLRDMVQTWVSNPATNSGLLLAGQGSAALEFDLRSSDEPNASLRPKLIVTYAP